MTRHDLVESITTKLTPAHLRLLEVCDSYPKAEDGSFCGKWIMHTCDSKALHSIKAGSENLPTSAC